MTILRRMVILSERSESNDLSLLLGTFARPHFEPPGRPSTLHLSPPPTSSTVIPRAVSARGICFTLLRHPKHPGVRLSKGRARFQPCHKKNQRITNCHSACPELRGERSRPTSFLLRSLRALFASRMVLRDERIGLRSRGISLRPLSTLP